MVVRLPDRWQSGDVLAFSGRGLISLGIKLATLSRYSHIAVVGCIDGRPLVFESTTLVDTPCEITGQKICGVQAHSPTGRIELYNGRMWLLRISPRWRTLMNEAALNAELMRRIGTPYDGRGAILSGTRAVKYWLPYSRYDLSSIFCSEYVAESLKLAGLMCPSEIAGRWNPARLVEVLLGSGVYDEPRLIKG